ncbi:MAG: 30S ribosomal protein S17 [Actinomycetota bacterium]|nr:30S ribosomal protein S17 [Actinomycetota bacterium]
MAERTPRKQRIGRVASNAMDKTVVVTVDTLAKHPLYGKTIKKSKNFYAHDEDNQCEVGDMVKIVETRPLSKTKRWRVVSVIEKAK